ncbi:leucyl aminopeptidase family protein [Arenibaculum sp.]|jgi:leucyl aminopeptidase|uniref:leucyl aminopeptidase family protein n=1 Tax=Arenibaculum sp. TaxID=2865862 RepID=UPI002E0F059E|nr:leucyl aminopeptidase family protein [Arenibaculum sp.]
MSANAKTDTPTLRSADGAEAVPLTLVAKPALDAWREAQPPRLRAWAEQAGFKAEAGGICLVPDDEGRLARVLAGLGDGEDPWAAGSLPGALPPGCYRLDPEPEPAAATRHALAWALGSYAFTRYRRKEKTFASLVWPQGADRAAVERAAGATHLVRDLVNTPAGDLGPAELAEAALDLAREFGAEATVVVGDDLLAGNWPAVHAVGRASTRAPRLVDLAWGEAGAPLVAVIGKGVCFDTGGLDIKPSSAMLNMKKDMGGAAHALGLARMVMAAKLPVRLRVLIPAVENSISGDAFRPMDVLRTRKGLTVEVGNTDAEGRLILCDALHEAAQDRPDLMIDFATLTGAARVALGPDLPALFCNDDALAADLLAAGAEVADPLWRLPLHRGYRRMLDSKVADINNTGSGGHAGAITAALFLQAFVPDGVRWAHLDTFAWNQSSRPARPEGGEALGMRAAFRLLEQYYGK